MKTYSKRKSIITLIVFALALAGILLMVLLGIGFEHVGRWDQFGKGLDLEGGVSITYQAKEGASQQDMDDTIMKLQERVEEFSTEAQVYQEGTNRITVEIPGQNDPAVVLAELGNPGTLIFCTDAAKPQESTALTGNDITDAYAATNPEKTSEYVVVLTLTTEGQAKFAEVTGKIAGTGKPLYIMFDGEIISQPVARQKITSPTCQVEGITDLQEATRLASYIRIGALPTELQEISSRVVGATLGANAVNASITAMAIGLAIICILMIIVFRMPGFAASVALVSYTGLVFLILSIFRESITLTLPGIAGIILGIGMAVDANVIIFSRIREEIGLGSGTATAIHTGFSKALSAIIDGNVTTLLAAIVLWIFGTGPVKGFAVTLTISILLSMFSSLVLTRLLLKSFYGLGLKDEKWYGKKKQGKVIDFIKRRWLYIGLSCAVILAGIGFMVLNGTKEDKYPLNYSLDFVGGTQTTVNFNEYRDAAALEREVQPRIQEAIGSQDVVLTPSFDTGNTEVIIKTQVLTEAQREAMYKVLEDDFNIRTDNITYSSISATVSKEMARNAIISVIIASIVMLAYIWIRFRDLRFAGASVLALVHDVFVVLAGYAIFRWTVGNTFIACMLTLVGYSINATIVTFDRIRELLKAAGKDPDYKEIANRAVTQTVGRSVYTSLTTLIMVVMLYIFGASAIREFALPLMVGLVVGCYSSICIASGIWYIFRTKIGAKKTAKAAKA